MKANKNKIFGSSKFVIYSLSLFLIGLIGVSSLTSCWNVVKKNNNVIFSIAQSKFWPMAIALRDVVPHYNQTQKNKEGFVPVELITTENSNLTSEARLLNDTIHKIAAKNENEIPSLILNTNSSASTINSYDRLLDLSDILKSTDFAADLIPLYNKVAGKQANNSERLYALPYNLSTTESLAINLPVLKFLVDQAIYNGAILEENTNDIITKNVLQTNLVNNQILEESIMTDSNIVKSLKNIETSNNIKKIEKTEWKRFKYNQPLKNITTNRTLIASVEDTSDNVLKEKKLQNYKINNDTFKYFDKLMEFTKKIESILEPQNLDETIPEILPTLNILSIDYPNNIFKRLLWEKNGSNIDEYIWKYKNVKEKNNIIQVDYTFLKNNESDKSTKFKEAYKEFIKDFKETNKSLGLRNVLYTQNTNDWGSWLLRTFDTAIGIVPNVGIRQSVQSQLSQNFFASDKNKSQEANQNQFNSFAKIDEDVKWYHQFTRTSQNKNLNNQLETYLAGGSSLIPISVNAHKNTGLKNFLKWIYKGETIIDGQRIKVTDWIEKLSGYFVPIQVNYGTEEIVKNTIKKYKAKAEEAKEKKIDEQFTYKSLQLSAEDYLLFLKSKKTVPYETLNDNKKSPLFNPAGDINTAQISNEINGQMKSMKNGKKIDEMALFDNLVSKFKHLR